MKRLLCFPVIFSPFWMNQWITESFELISKKGKKYMKSSAFIGIVRRMSIGLNQRCTTAGFWFYWFELHSWNVCSFISFTSFCITVKFHINGYRLHSNHCRNPSIFNTFHSDADHNNFHLFELSAYTAITLTFMNLVESATGWIILLNVVKSVTELWSPSDVSLFNCWRAQESSVLKIT